ncbi:MAG: PAS domain-containing protein [Deltaproteobacteria bacterium]|nr:PAS domain-containing protein [Deltaproteobacteria bacterium]
MSGPFPWLGAATALLLAGGLVFWAWAWRLRGQARQQAAGARRLSEAIRRTRETHQVLLDHTDALIFTLDQEGRYLTFNRAAREVLGHGPVPAEGKFVEEHLDPPGAAKFRTALARALAEGEARLTRQPLKLVGRERFLDLYLKLLGPPGGSGLQVLCIVRDQTAEKLRDDMLWQTEKLASLGLLAAGVAHQINNPLGILMGFAEILADRTPAGAPGHRELAIIQEQGQECKRIVDGLLNFHRLSELGLGRPDLLASLHAVLQLVSGVLKHKGIQVDLDLPDRLPPTPAGGGVMEQVLLNLLANAMDALPRGGLLRVGAAYRVKPPRQGDLHGTLPAGPSYVEITVQDNGPGIAPEHLERIFDPFFTTKPVGQGTGLGLSVAHGLVRELRGTLTCQSPPPDGSPPGARFTVRLPVEDAARPDLETPHDS